LLPVCRLQVSYTPPLLCQEPTIKMSRGHNIEENELRFLQLFSTSSSIGYVLSFKSPSSLNASRISNIFHVSLSPLIFLSLSASQATS
jgi:hypothetical protein